MTPPGAAGRRAAAPTPASLAGALLLVLSSVPLPSVSAVASSCPAPWDGAETCTPVSSWSDFTSAASNGGRVVLCAPFSVVRGSLFKVYNAVDVICAKSSPNDECEIVGGSGYHLDIRTTSGAGVRLSGLTFRSAPTTSVVVRYGSGHAICDGTVFEDNSRPTSSGAAVLQYAGTELLVETSTFRNNLSNNGGAIYSKGALKVVDSSFEGNTATYGGAIKTSGGTLEISGSTFTDNLSTKTGPAIAYYSSAGDFVDGENNVGTGNVAQINGVECNGFYAGGTCHDFYVPPFFLDPEVVQYDAHGSLAGYQSCTRGAASCGADWTSAWETYGMLLDGAYDVDPFDSRAIMRGSGSISTAANSEVVVFKKSPRFYIAQQPGDPGWENVEFTAYGMYASDPFTRPYSGLTLAARSDHGSYKIDGCLAPTYYARIYRDSGNVGFIKEYYHDVTNESVYAPSIQAPLFEGGLPFGEWIGMKFVVYTVPGTFPGDVRLELYVDVTDGTDGGSWELVHSYVDTPGGWLPNEPVPSQCADLTDEGETVLGPRAHCFFRVSGYDDGTEVHWKKGSIRNISPQMM